MVMKCTAFGVDVSSMWYFFEKLNDYSSFYLSRLAQFRKNLACQNYRLRERNMKQCNFKGLINFLCYPNLQHWKLYVDSIPNSKLTPIFLLFTSKKVWTGCTRELHSYVEKLIHHWHWPIFLAYEFFRLSTCKTDPCLNLFQDIVPWKIKEESLLFLWKIDTV